MKSTGALQWTCTSTSVYRYRALLFGRGAVAVYARPCPATADISGHGIRCASIGIQCRATTGLHYDIRDSACTHRTH